MSNDLITEIGNIAIALSFVVALVFSIFQVRASERDRRERLTLDMIRNFQTYEFAVLIQYISQNAMPTTREDFLKMSADEQAKFIQFSQQMESLGMLVYDRYIDIDLVDKTLGSFVTVSWDRYKAMFMDMRERNPDPFLGEYFQWLAENIDKRMTENPREPFYKTPAKS